MRRATLVFLLATAVTVLVPGPANAGGGWWSNIDLDDPIVIGASLDFRERDVIFSTPADVKAAVQTEWHAYLLQGFDRRALYRAMERPEPTDWLKTRGPVIQIGDVELSDADVFIGHASVQITVPQIRTGSYYLMLCDVGCQKPLGGVIPLRIDVVADAFSAQLAQRLRRTNLRLEEALTNQGNRLRRTRNTLAELESSVKLSRESVTTLAHRVTELERAEPPSTPWSAFAGWFLAGAATSALVVVAMRRRKTRASVDSEPAAAVRVPDDPRELIESR